MEFVLVCQKWGGGGGGGGGRLGSVLNNVHIQGFQPIS